jgi:heptose-I-phosphate ethanolaminephosphotransferase
MVAYIVLIGWVSVLQNPVPRWMIIFFQAWLAAAVIELLHWRIVKWLSYALAYTLFITELVLEWHFGMYLSPTILTLLVETNGQESSEFLSALFKQQNFGITIAYIALLIAANVTLEMGRRRINATISGDKTIKVLKAIAALLLVSGAIFTTISYAGLFSCREMNDIDEWRTHRRNPDDVVTKFIVAVFDTRLSASEMDNANEQTRHISVIPQELDGDSLNVILVIGESYIRDHASLYGYPLHTTPFMDAEQQAGRLFAFTDAVSPYNQTTKVIRNLISCNSLGDGEHWSSAPPLTAVFKKNGYWVSMQDNQKSTDGHVLSELFEFSLATYLYSSQMVEACYNEMNDATYDFDGQLIDAYRKQMAKSADATHRFTVFHLMGQHVSFNCRYPHDHTFNHFTPDSTARRKEQWLTDEMRQEIADYDNATLYNDDVIRRITELYGNSNTVVLYLSDHGEEVYDYRPRSGRDDFSYGTDIQQGIRHQYCIPYVIWCSEKYKELHPDIVSRLQQYTDRPVAIDNTCQLLFRLAGLKTPYYRSRLDVLSDDYHCPPRMLNDEVNYEETMR